MALDFIEKHSLEPRDAMHLAVMKENRVETIVSNDEDFERSGWVKRTKFYEFD